MRTSSSADRSGAASEAAPAAARTSAMALRRTIRRTEAKGGGVPLRRPLRATGPRAERSAPRRVAVARAGHRASARVVRGGAGSRCLRSLDEFRCSRPTVTRSRTIAATAGATVGLRESLNGASSSAPRGAGRLASASCASLSGGTRCPQRERTPGLTSARMSTWIFEPGHTEAEFRARHMMVKVVRALQGHPRHHRVGPVSLRGHDLRRPHRRDSHLDRGERARRPPAQPGLPRRREPPRHHRHRPLHRARG